MKRSCNMRETLRKRCKTHFRHTRHVAHHSQPMFTVWSPRSRPPGARPSVWPYFEDILSHNRGKISPKYHKKCMRNSKNQYISTILVSINWGAPMHSFAHAGITGQRKFRTLFFKFRLPPDSIVERPKSTQNHTQVGDKSNIWRKKERPRNLTVHVRHSHGCV